MSQSQKQYPKNAVYNNNEYKGTTFQPTSKSNESKNITNISGTSLAEISSSYKPGKSSTGQISILHERIEYLQKELEMVTQLLSQEQSKKTIIENLQKQNKNLVENLNKTEEINMMLENQLVKSQNNNQELLNALKGLSQQFQTIKNELAEKKMQENINDSKSSMKSKAQVQQDIIRLNEQISNVLEKLHSLNQDYQILRQKNEKLESENRQLIKQLQRMENEGSKSKQKEQMNSSISNLEQNLSQALKKCQKYKNQYEYCKQEISLLKQQIHQVNQLSIKKQKQIQDEYYEKERAIYQELAFLKEQLKESRALSSQNDRQRQRHSDQSSLIQIKNVMIRKLELDNQILKQQKESKQKQLSRIRNNQKNRQNESYQSNKKIEDLNESYKQKLFNLEMNYKNKIGQLESQIYNMNSVEQKIVKLEQQNRQKYLQIRSKEQKIQDLQTQLNQLKRKQFNMTMIEQELKELKSREVYQSHDVKQMQKKNKEIAEELNEIKKHLERVKNQVVATKEIKQKYGEEIVQLKKKMRQLRQTSDMHQKHLKSVESSHQNSQRKRDRDRSDEVSIRSESNIQPNKRIQQLEQNNRELQKIILNQKVQKQNQNKRYRQLLQDYKQLNHQLTTELGLYRDANNPDHPNCPIKESPLKIRVHNPKSDRQIRKQMQTQKQKYFALLSQHEKTLQRYKGIEGRMHHLQKSQQQLHFLKLDNSSMRAQITQQNIRIEEHKSIIQDLRRQGNNKILDAEKLRFAMQRQFQGKMEIQRMQIINQYNSLLRNRNIRVQPNQYRSSQYYPQHTQYRTNIREPYIRHEQPSQHVSEVPYFPSNQVNGVNLDSGKIRYHPEYKKLQQEYMKLHRQYLEAEQSYNKTLIQYRDEIQKLVIENQYHRKTIDELHAQGYGIYNQDEQNRREEADLFKNKYEQINRAYQKLYQQFVALKSKPGHSHHNSILFGDVQIPSLNNQHWHQNRSYVSNLDEKQELSRLKRLMDQKLIQLELTPRQPSTILQRANWLIQKLAELVSQLKKDRDTVRNQKKEISKQNDKLKVKIETIEYQNSHLLKELAVVAQKFKYLEQKNLKIGNGLYSSKPTQSISPRTPKISFEIPNITFNSNKQRAPVINGSNNQKDVYLHEAGLIREQRIALLQKFQRDIDNLDSQN